MALRIVLFLLIAFAAGPASAAAPLAEPWGEWLVSGGSAHIRVVECGGALWGVVAWEKSPGIDDKNPDPAKRTRPTTGIPIMLGMKPGGPGKWDGSIYNSDNGKTYSGGVRVNANGSLRIFGCVLGFLCGGETWTRTTPMPGALDLGDAELCDRIRAS